MVPGEEITLRCFNRKQREQRSALTLLQPQSRCGDISVKFQVLRPQNGTAVLKGLTQPQLWCTTHHQPRAAGGNELRYINRNYDTAVGGAVYLWASWVSFENPNTLPVWHTSYNITLIATLWGRSKKVEKLQQCTYRWTSGRNEIHQEMHGNLMVRAWGGVEWLRSGCAQHLNAHLVLASLNPLNSNWHCYHVEGVDSCARHQQQTASPTELKNSKLKEEDKQVSGAG